MIINPIWSICLITRACLAYIVYRFGDSKKEIKYGLTRLLLIIGVAFLYKGYYGSNNETQLGPVFWHDSRFIHGTMYLHAGLCVRNGELINASALIMVDIVFSILYRVMNDR